MRLEADMHFRSGGNGRCLEAGVKPPVLVNNFMNEETSPRQRSKSVLFNADVGIRERTSKRSFSVSRADEDVDKLSVNGVRGQRLSSDADRRDNCANSRNSVSDRGNVSPRRVSVRSNERTLSRSTRGRSESMSSDSTDGIGSLVGSYNGSSAWEVFEDHVRNVHVPVEMVARKSRISFNSSDTFQRTMTVLYGKPEYNIEPEPPKPKPKVGNINNVASRLLATTRRRRKAKSSAIKEERPPPSKTVVENARRGWRIIRRHVNEMIAEKKGSSAAFNWSMLTQSMRGLTDMDRARIDMYKRYGIIPTVRSDGTTVQENSMLSEKARAAKSFAMTFRPKPPKQSEYSRRATMGLQRSRAA